MAAKAKDGSSGKHLSRGTTSLPSNPRTPATTTTTIKKKPKQTPPPSPSEKRVPRYLKPTASSRPDGPKPTRNSATNYKPADLDQRRSFEKPSSSTLTKSHPSLSSSSSTNRRIRPPRSLSLSPITPASSASASASASASSAMKKKKKKEEKAADAIKTKDIAGDPVRAEQGETESVDELSEMESGGMPCDILNPESSRDRVDGAMEGESLQEPPATEEGERDGEYEAVCESNEMLRAEGGGRGEEEEKAKERERKKETSTVYNDVIEERRSQLLEEKKNKVKALVGAFETVISLQEPDS